jgi:hypothetical protein
MLRQQQPLNGIRKALVLLANGHDREMRERQAEQKGR